VIDEAGIGPATSQPTGSWRGFPGSHNPKGSDRTALDGSFDASMLLPRVRIEQLSTEASMRACCSIIITRPSHHPAARYARHRGQPTSNPCNFRQPVSAERGPGAGSHAGRQRRKKAAADYTEAQAVAAVLLANGMGNTATANGPKPRLQSGRNSAHC